MAQLLHFNEDNVGMYKRCLRWCNDLRIALKQTRRQRKRMGAVGALGQTLKILKVLKLLALCEDPLSISEYA